MCGDFGWVRRDVPVGHPAYGKAFPCSCQKTTDDPSRLARLQLYSNLGPLSRATFEATEPDGRGTLRDDRALFRDGYQVAQAFAEDPRGWLVLTGPSGCGKTHLAAAIANRVLAKGQPAFFVFVPDLLDHLRSTFNPSSEESYDQLFEQVRSAPFLILDDLGGQSSTPWAQEKLYQILNFRHTSRLPTVFTTTLALDELEPRWQTRLGDPEVARHCPLGAARVGGPLAQAGLPEPEMVLRMTFDAFNVSGNRASYAQRLSLEAAFKMAHSFAQAPEGWLVLLGPTGCGKTHLAHAIAGERIRAGNRVHYFRVADLLDYLRDTFNPESAVTYDRLFQEVRNAPLLILEDFGTHHPTPWAREKLHQILVHRHDARLPTVITTAELDEDKRSDPIVSRLLDVTLVSIVPLDAPDYRFQGRAGAE